MRWVEIITLRSNGNFQESLIQELLKPGAKGDGSNGLIAMKIYRNAWVSNDLSIHLRWRSMNAEPKESPIGIRLSETLKELGLVNHSIWVEEKKERGSL